MNKFKLITILTIISVLTGCIDAEKNKLDNRVIDYWTHKINKDYAAAYEFLSPGWKSNEQQQAFVDRMRNSRAEWKSVKILDKQCQEIYLCTMSLEIEYAYMFQQAAGEKIQIPSKLQENWLMEDNIWYHVPIKSKIKARK